MEVNSEKPKSKKKNTIKPATLTDSKPDRKSRSKAKKKDSGDITAVESIKLDRKQSSRLDRKQSSRIQRSKLIPPAPAPSKEDLLQAEDDFSLEGLFDSKEEDPQPPPEPTNEDLCREIMEEFRQEAWDICLERFMFSDGPQKIAFELRDTWQRIMEAEWMDETRVTQSTLPASFFLTRMQDDPPLPMRFDFWSKGTLEFLPRHRRESVMDPFIHGAAKDRASISSSFENIGGGDAFVNRKGSGSKVKIPTSQVPRHPSKQLINEGSGPQIDKPKSDTIVASSVSPSQSTQGSLDIEFLKQAVKMTSSSSIQYKQLGIKPWTVSQCGGKDGTRGVYRLVNQTTSEAIGKGLHKDLPVAKDRTFDDADDEEENTMEGAEELKDEIVEFVSPSDYDTETLYESRQQDEDADGTSKNISNLPSELEIPKPREPFVDYTAKFKKGLQREAKSKQDRSRLNAEESIVSGQPESLPNPKRVGKMSRYKRKGNKPKAVQTPIEPQVQNVSKSESPKPFICKLNEDNELMKERLAIAKARNEIIQRHRDSLRQRPSTQSI